MAVTTVFGAGGATGLECVKRLLATNQDVRAVVRDPSKYAGLLPEDKRLSVLKGDVTDPKSVEAALTGASGAIFAASGKGYWSADSVDHKGVATVAAAAKEAGVGHVVLVSSMMVTPQNRFQPIRMFLNNIRWGLMDAKFAGENALRASGVPYTVVRPGGLTNEAGGREEVVARQGDKVVGGPTRVSRADVAAVCVEALRNPQAAGVTLEVVARAPAQPEGWTYEEQLGRLFTGLTKD